ncbi:efflux RND transporter periplasmic adaptor subunit [Schlesneria paludicola]|uniref:efflux RND transporter periplasmic adaptor subunit n=1 Tax=Schlesneria paludicola TaxID=360056 RepID=UPI0002E039D0|nr:HlyD family efflux transporter periplasmic adaptor subunit [Schlesneria paludicola]
MSLTAGCLLGLLMCSADPVDEIRVESVLLTLIEHADVSASETGLLSLLTVKEGETVAEGKPLAKIDDRDAKLICDRSETELKVARSFADNDVRVRFARLSVAVANAELTRAKESNVKFPKSVSQSEIDRLKLLADKSVLEVEQAEVDQLQAKLSLQIKQQELARAILALERRTIIAPFPGMVVQWKKQHGEWVEPGMPVMRLIRLNRLRAEAFVASGKLPANLVGRPVKLVMSDSGKSAIKYTGTLVFVSPEIDPVNGQVRIWAEIENDSLSLRPGESGTLMIGPATLSKPVITDSTATPTDKKSP